MRHVALILIFSAALTGCDSFPKQMTGQFNAQRGDFIVIEKDGSFLWSPPAKSTDRLRFVGIGSPDSNGLPQMTVVVPSASSVFPSVTFSADYSHATVEWDRYLPATDGAAPYAADAAAGRSTEFERIRKK
jgi:hypothetical protein